MAWKDITFRRTGLILLVIVVGRFMNGCVEVFEPQTEIFESVLIVEATLTNEFKQHEIMLSRTFRFEENVPKSESGANVVIKDDLENEYVFEEASLGRYVSRVSFEAEPNRGYQLHISTNDGKVYSSESEQLPQVTSMDNVYAERLTNDDNIDGLSIFVDSFDPDDRSKFYRYEYEETYKIIPPRWNEKGFVEVPGPQCRGKGVVKVEVLSERQNERVCYATDSSKNIILANTSSLDEDRLTRFQVRFIESNNFILAHRYSILVRQFIQSNAAHTYFETLLDFSGSESLLSETQPGFLSGNIYSEDSIDERILGYFDVASVSEKRIFFNYENFFSSEEPRPFLSPCRELIPAPDPCLLRFWVENNMMRYSSDNQDPVEDEGPYDVVPRYCGDCTVLGRNEIPEFWIE